MAAIMSYLYSILWSIVVLGIIIYFVFVKKSRNRKAAETGEDKERVRQAAGQMLVGVNDYQLAYAHWEEHESYGRTVKTTYFRYGAAFQGETLWIFPLHIDKRSRQVQAGNPITLTSRNLGKVTVKTKEKNGVISRVEAWLGDKQGHAIAQLYVDAENLRKSRWFPVNILQPQECEAFSRFITALAQQVASENPGIDAVIAAEVNEGYGVIGAGLSIAGAVGAMVFPPFGAVLCLIGLILSIVGKSKGAKSKKCLIISIICMVWAVFFNYMYFTIMW